MRIEEIMQELFQRVCTGKFSAAFRKHFVAKLRLKSDIITFKLKQRGEREARCEEGKKNEN
jgi:hypothetical protein